MGYTDKRDRISALVLLPDKLEEGFKRQFTTLMNRVEHAYTIRNLVAHSTWNKGEGRGAITPPVIKAKGGPVKISGSDFKDEHFTAPRLKGEADTITRLIEDFRQFFTTHYGATFVSKRGASKKGSD